MCQIQLPGTCCKCQYNQVERQLAEEFSHWGPESTLKLQFKHAIVLLEFIDEFIKGVLFFGERFFLDASIQISPSLEKILN